MTSWKFLNILQLSSICLIRHNIFTLSQWLLITLLIASPRVANTSSAVAAASSNLRTFGTNSSTPPKSAARIAQDLMRSKGIGGLYKGLGATLARCTKHFIIDLNCLQSSSNALWWTHWSSIGLPFSGTFLFPVSTFHCLPFSGLRLVSLAGKLSII